ncbi:MAG: hypothetical protein IID45_14735 [Planctomycetes bacterium]|nr:hypothetical protein [Planctomycetota bacterium]
MKRILLFGLLGSTVLLFNGCSSSEPEVSVVDLNKVLDIFEKVLNEKAPGAPAQAKAGEKPAAGDPQDVGVPDVQENKDKTAAFLKRLAKKLNDAKLIEAPIGVQLQASGAIEGFIDDNKDGIKQPGSVEKTLFTVEIDTERNRLIATDSTGQGGETYRRERGYHRGPGLGTGLFMGYMLGSMMGRQRGYYGGGGRARPNYGRMKMSPRNYHSKAVTSARGRAKARGGSYGGRTKGGGRAGGGGGGGARRGGGGGYRGGK